MANSGSFKKGQKPGPGRPKGSLDKGNAALRDMIRQALDQAGGVQYLYELSQSDPKAFTALLGRLLPVEVAGEGGGAIKHEHAFKWLSDSILKRNSPA